MMLALFVWKGNTLEKGHKGDKGEIQGERMGVVVMWGEVTLIGSDHGKL